MLKPEDIELINETLAQATPVTGKYLLTFNQHAEILTSDAGPIEPERTNMPYLQQGEKLQTGFNQFRKLKDVGDKIRFRIIGTPFVEGKHFFQTPEGWDIKPCPRINDNQECTYCAIYFNALRDAKKSGDEKKVQAVKTDSKMKPYKVSLIVYYPILNRNESKFEIFQTVMSVRDAIEAEAAMGVDTAKNDFVVICTNGVGLNKYKLSRVDSSDNPPLTEEEELEVEKGKKVRLDEMVAGSPDAESEVAQQNDTVIVEVDA